MRLFFLFEKKPWGHFGAYGVKFRTSPKLDNLYVKMKLLTWTFQKKLLAKSFKVIRGQKSRERVKKEVRT